MTISNSLPANYDFWTSNGFTPANGYTVVKDSSGSGYAAKGTLQTVVDSVKQAFGSFTAPPKMDRSTGQVVNISSWGGSGAQTATPVVTQQAVPATPTTIQRDPVVNQFDYLMNMANGKDQYGNSVTPGQEEWAKSQLQQFYGTGGVVPTHQTSNPVQPPSSNDLLPSTGGVGGMIDKVAPIAVLLVLVKIVTGIFVRG